MPKSRFVFKAHKYAADESRTYGLVDVFDRENGEHLGMLNPTADGCYILRDRTGERLSVRYGGRFDDMVWLSREASAAILKQRVAIIDQNARRRATSVSAGCANNWHNTADHRANVACPDCPSRIGRRGEMIVSALHRLSGVERSKAVAVAFREVVDNHPGKLARVAYNGSDGTSVTLTGYLIGVAWNPSHTGTQEALIVRQPEHRYEVEMIPFTRLISIQAAS